MSIIRCLGHPHARLLLDIAKPWSSGSQPACMLELLRALKNTATSRTIESESLGIGADNGGFQKLSR